MLIYHKFLIASIPGSFVMIPQDLFYMDLLQSLDHMFFSISFFHNSGDVSMFFYC